MYLGFLLFKVLLKNIAKILWSFVVYEKQATFKILKTLLRFLGLCFVLFFWNNFDLQVKQEFGSIWTIFLCPTVWLLFVKCIIIWMHTYVSIGLLLLLKINQNFRILNNPVLIKIHGHLCKLHFYKFFSIHSSTSISQK